MKKAILLLLALVVYACGPSREKASSTAILIKNVHVVDVIGGTVLEDQLILVDSGRILAIAAEIPGAQHYSKTIDGQGSYALPGLTEMHAHIPSPPTPEKRIEETLFLYLAGGVTTIRGMLGHPYHLDLRQQVGRGEVPGPRIFTSRRYGNMPLPVMISSKSTLGSKGKFLTPWQQQPDRKGSPLPVMYRWMWGYGAPWKAATPPLTT